MKVVGSNHHFSKAQWLHARDLHRRRAVVLQDPFHHQIRLADEHQAIALEQIGIHDRIGDTEECESLGGLRTLAADDAGSREWGSSLRGQSDPVRAEGVVPGQAVRFGEVRSD